MFYYFSELINVATKRIYYLLISFSVFSYALPVFTSASAVGNFWSTCLGFNILIYDFNIHQVAFSHAL